MIQALSGSEVIPAMWTRRVASSITNSTTLARQTRRDPHLHGKEIGGGKDVPVRFQKLPPGRAFLPLGRWLNPVLLEDGSDGPASHVVAQNRERPLNACVTPIAILRRHTHHQLPNLGDRRRPSGSAALMAVVLPRDEMPMPGEEGVGAHDRLELLEHAASQAFRLGRQSNALIVGEPETARTELLSKDAIFSLEIIDHLALLLVDPAGQGDEQKPQRV